MIRNYIFFITLLSFYTGNAQTAKEIIQTADAKMRGNTSQAQITIQTIRPSWSREMTVKTWVKGNELALILVQSPAKEKALFS